MSLPQNDSRKSLNCLDFLIPSLSVAHLAPLFEADAVEKREMQEPSDAEAPKVGIWPSLATVLLH